LLLCAALWCSSAFAQDAATIIERSVQANDRDWQADPQYDYSERDLDSAGSKTYEVTTIFGSPYERLVAVNGKPLTPQQQAEEQRKYERMESERRAESPQKKAQRIRKYYAERTREHAMMAELTKAFDFKLEGQQSLDGHKVYVLDAIPCPGYHPPNRNAQVLTGMRGKLWVDESTFQWVKVEASVFHPVAIVGFLARVQPGTRFELEKAPVSDDVWLPTHFAMKAAAKVMYVFNHHSQEEDYYFNYHRANSTASMQSSGR
jgi:hypothetical protein